MYIEIVLKTMVIIMSVYKINIIQGDTKLERSDINITIDVIRAFTVSHYAFLNNIETIILTNEESIALSIKNKNKNVLLAGEVNGIKIDSFDFGNSPYDISHANLDKKTLVQKTTNGVKVTLNSLDTDNLFVTGYSNAYTTAIYVKNIIKNIKKDIVVVNIIASHPCGDDDLACALYIKEVILNNLNSYKHIEEKTVNRIIRSAAAKKFYDMKNKEFSILDISLCCVKVNSNFVMKIKEANETIFIDKIMVN